MTSCPYCNIPGHSIGAATLKAQTIPTRLNQIVGYEGWHMCTSSTCEIIYFRNEETITASAILALPFHKSNNPNRLVCFCFTHTVAEIEFEVHTHGTSSIQKSIKAACKKSLHDCAHKNPQGRCCLGNIGQVIKGIKLS